ncbi:hypothetical protein OIV83_005428 [Microbotryomycetes sp. JL201]|nr:hypothetical protein OIV83_005428 [Microbotryomycetes sp. JL201]
MHRYRRVYREAAGKIKRKGRGFANGQDAGAGDEQAYDSIDVDGPEPTAGSNPQRSVEGWIVIVTNVHEEASEEDLQDKFGEYGDVQNLHLNLDRRTGYVKGYALIEYAKREEAEAAIAGASGSQLLEQTIKCDFAFVRPPVKPSEVKGAARRGGRDRSASPQRRQPLRNRID